jgi:Mrp family chromosome partitioning ATPase
VLALVGGVIGGVAIAFFLEYLDHGLKTPEDVEFHLGIPPLASFFQGSGERLDPRASRRLVTMVDASGEKEMQMLAVASSDPGEGSLRVARAMAEAQSDDPERRTLLLDFRGDGASDRAAGPGALDVLEGTGRLEDVTRRDGSLYVIGRGTSEEAPVYLWRSDAMRDLLTRLRQDYDRIIVHVPPILQSHDALHLLRHADGLVLVIRADSTRREVVQRALEILGDRADKVLGAVLTDRRQVIPEAVYRRI